MINNNPIIKVGCGEGTVAMGVVGNFNARQQTFDISLWTQQLGEGTLIISLLRPGDAAPYAVADVVVDGSTATWTFDDTDTAVGGWGKVFLTYRGDGFEDATTDYEVYIATNSAPAGDTPPEPLESWYQRMLEAAANAQIAAANAAASAEAAAGSESTIEAYKDAAQTAAANAAASQALANQYAAAAALARQAAETAATEAENAQTAAEAAKASAIASAQAAAADKLEADASAAAAQAAEQAALASQAAAAASAAAAAGSEQSVADNAAAAIAARDAAQRAQEAAQAASSAAASSAASAANSAATAQTAASDAAQSAQAAAASATNASGSATLAESWAVGGTDTRAGEDTDNAQYYATRSASSASSAAQSAAAAQEAQVKAPIIQNRTWWVWSQTQGQYVDTGVDAGGRVEFESLTEEQKIELEQSIGANPLLLSGASVGDFAQITETDANGVPTKWTPVSTVDALGLSIVNGQLCITYEEAV